MCKYVSSCTHVAINEEEIERRLRFAQRSSFGTVPAKVEISQTFMTFYLLARDLSALEQLHNELPRATIPHSSIRSALPLAPTSD